MYGQNATAMLKQGMDLDFSHEIKVSREERYRFRVNATSSYAGFEDGIQITCRVISSRPPTLSDLNVEPALVSGFYPDHGLVVIAGPTGSGKSTLLAAAVRSILEDPSVSKKILTYEAPIEYVYDEIHSQRSLISQHEVPRHIKSFPQSVRNALRRAPKIILVGESRDSETVSAALEASETGHALYTTVHANSVPETIYRMVNLFHPAERATKRLELLESVQTVATQRLVRTVEGKRTALREWLHFTEDIRMTLRGCESLREVVEVLSKETAQKKQTLRDAAIRALDAGLISPETAGRYTQSHALYEN
jgi:defect in organelle trafficking protein DotB